MEIIEELFTMQLVPHIFCTHFFSLIAFLFLLLIFHYALQRLPVTFKSRG